MDIKTHFIVSLIISIALYPLYGGLAFLALLVGFAIDIDHYLAYFLLKGRLHPLGTYRYFKKLPKDRDLEILYQPYVFHSAEFLLLILIFYSSWMTPFVAGLVAHLLMDLVDELQGRRFPAKKTSLIFLYLWRAYRYTPLSSRG